jgi:hypothetical protein
MTFKNETPTHVLEARWRNHLVDETTLVGPHHLLRANTVTDTARDSFCVDRTVWRLSQGDNAR